jgi:16S rRNA (cytosine967-C5)-methyltransferase
MQDKSPIDTEIATAISAPKMGSKDRKLIAGTVYDIIKNYRFIQYITNKAGGKHENERHILETYCALHAIKYPDDPGNYRPDPDEVHKIQENPDIPPEVRYSIPDWLHHHIIKNGSFDWPEVMETLSGIAPLFLRVNTLKCTDDELATHLKAESIDFDIISPHCFKLNKHQNLSRDAFFLKGMFEIQDSGSQLISTFTAPSPGTMVIDACAGAGGKSLHLASLMNDKGVILALDINPKPLNALKSRAEKAGVLIIKSHLYKEIKLADYKGLADQILCDVPCTATGVLRRQVDQKWRLRPEDLHSLLHTQREIMNQSWDLLKPGGEMVYSTCSILPDENHLQVEDFIAHHADAHLMASQLLLPQTNGQDGFYMAKIKKRTN